MDKHQKTMLVAMIALLAVIGWKIYEYETVYAKAIDTTAMIGGQEVEFSLIPGTVKDNLIYNEISYDDDDEIVPAPREKVSEDTVITVDEVHFAVETRTEKVKKETYVVLDPKMESGEQEQKDGHDGEGVFTYTTRFVNGEDRGTDRELSKWITEPEDRVLHLGTKRTGHEGKYKVTGEFTANCSAYWMGNNCRGASGGRCVYGTVAVDRHKYPYGTEFWIEGYGFAVANDCGSSIKGDKLDLWMDSFAESCRWGRRHKQTYILEKVEK